MPRPKLRMPVKAKPVKKRSLPDKVGKVKHIYDKAGNLLMVGTEAEWRKWVKTRPIRG